MIRVLRIITRLNIGGPSYHAMILTATLNDAEFESRLLCGVPAAAEGDLTPEAERRGIPVRRVPVLHNRNSAVDAARAVWALYRECRTWRPQIVHLHQFKARLLGAVAARAAGVPHVIQTYHGTLFHKYFRPPALTVLVALERCLGRWLTHSTVAVSDGVRRELLAWRVVPEHRVQVIALGLDLTPLLGAGRHAGALRRELGLPPDAVLVGFVGRLVPIKAAGVFLDALALVVREASRPVYGVVVGDGPERRRLEERAAAGLGNRVRFLGWRHDLVPVYGDLDVLAVSSYSEGTPVAIIEAMAARRAVVATRVGGVPDVVLDGSTGILVEPGDARALAAGIRRLVEEEGLRERLAAAAQASVYPKYDAATLCDATRRYYRGMLADAMGNAAGPRCAS